MTVIANPHVWIKRPSRYVLRVQGNVPHYEDEVVIRLPRQDPDAAARLVLRSYLAIGCSLGYVLADFPGYR